MRLIILRLLFVIVIMLQYSVIDCAVSKKKNLDELRELMRPMGKSCRTKTGAPDEITSDCANGKFPKIRPLMCYFKCLMIMMKLMNKDGQISQKVFENQIDMLVQENIAPRLKEVGNTCMKSVPFKEDSCEYAYDMVLCGYNLEKDMYFLP